MKLRKPSPAMVVAVIGMVLAMTGTGIAARGLITGTQIKDGTISAKDLSKAVRQQLAKTGAAGAAGPQGPPGPAGAPGAPGPAGSPDGPAEIAAKLTQADGPGSGVDADTVDGLQGADLEAAGADRSLTLHGAAWLSANPQVSITERGYSSAILRASGTVSGQPLAVLPLPLPSSVGDRRLRILQVTVCNAKLNDLGATSAVTGTGFQLNTGDETQVGGGLSLAPSTSTSVECPSTPLSPTGTLVGDGKFSAILLIGSTTSTTAQQLSRVTVRYRYAL